MDPTSAATEHLDGARVHRALSSSVRTRLLRLLLAHEVHGEVQALAAALELHVNTVRAHLAVLEGAGLVVSGPEQRARPGRPRLVYRPTDLAAEVVEPAAVASVAAERGYRFLATVLAGHLAGSSADPEAEARSAGVAWGRYLVDRPAPFERLDTTAAVERVVALLAEFGFEPELAVADHEGGPQGPDGPDGPGGPDPRGTPQVLLRRCPFSHVARDHPAVVCSLHLGLMRGALQELGGELDVHELRPFVAPDLCVAELEPARPGGPSGR
jgi:predicted ArsR family transcriptional regulator